MSIYYINLFRPYHNVGRDEISVTRALIVACAKSVNGSGLFKEILTKAGFNEKFSENEDPFEYELEVPAQRVKNELSEKSHKYQYVLCITPSGKIEESPWNYLFKDQEFINKQAQLKKVVPKVGEINLKSFENIFSGFYPDFSIWLKNQPELERDRHLHSAFGDTWRLLYAGSRPDAVVHNSNHTCLIESKIWGAVSESQVKNHALESFGSQNVPIFKITWQSVYEISNKIAECEGDIILKDFADYLSDFSQLVRWNGFDEKHVDAFRQNADKVSGSELQTRLQNHYWHCMDDLCNKYNYSEVTKRGFDWDFSPYNSKIIGNLGVGYWQLPRLAIKWCVGYHAWEMDQLGKMDILVLGQKASITLAGEIKKNNLKGIKVEFKAVQRFNYLNADDGVWADGSSYDLSQYSSAEEASNSLKRIWETEMSWLEEFRSRRGESLKSEEALKLKKDITTRRDPMANTDEIKMATKHSEWKLFPALNVFLWLSPKEFFSNENNHFISKEEQLYKLDLAINMLAKFAQTVSHGN